MNDEQPMLPLQPPVQRDSHVTVYMMRQRAVERDVIDNRPGADERHPRARRQRVHSTLNKAQQ